MQIRDEAQPETVSLKNTVHSKDCMYFPKPQVGYTALIYKQFNGIRNLYR